MLDAEVIEPAQSEWASPVVLIPKKDGSVRFCVDYRKLNALTVKDTYPLPRMDECLDSLGEATVFSTLDCNSGYWQIPIAPDDQDKTTFTCHSGTYRFTRMPFGLCNAPATFQRAVDILLMRYRWKTCLVYIDDVIIFSRSAEDHLRHVDEVLQVLRSSGMTLRLNKCHFFVNTVDYLGHVIRPGLLQVAQKNIEAIDKAIPPRTPTQVRSFLGLCNVYRRFVPRFAHIAAPLTQLTAKDAPSDLSPLTDEQLESFNALKNALTNAPILRLPRENLPYSIDTDASDGQIGCALFQTYDDGVRHPIGYWSRTLNKSEKNYSTSEKECLAVVWAVALLRPYLERTHFVINTDHQALTWLLALPDNQTTSRLIRWRLRLLEFDYEVRYVKGKKNQIADAISRLETEGYMDYPVDEDIPCLLLQQDEELNLYDDLPDTTLQDRDFDVVYTVDEGITPVTMEEIILEQAKDAFCCLKRTEMDRDKNSPFQLNEEGALVRIAPFDSATQIVVPRTLRKRVLHSSHYPTTAGHPGGRRMYYTLRRQYYWPQMSSETYTTARQCDLCAKERIRQQKIASKMKLFPATAPLESVALDLLGPLPRSYHGNNHLLVITDRFTKLTRTIPLKDPNASNTARAFCTHWAFVYGPPVTLLSDNGSQFSAKFFQNVCRIMGVKNLYTTSYHPRTNGQTERFNRTICSALRHYVNDNQRDWDDYSDVLTFGYNTQVHRATGLMPFELVLSRAPSPASLEKLPTVEGTSPRAFKKRFLYTLRGLFEKANHRMTKYQQEYKDKYDQRVRQRAMPLVGSYVYQRKHTPKSGENESEKRHNKLKYKVLGPFKVLRTFKTTDTLEIEKDGLGDIVSLDHVVPAPNIDDLRQELDKEPPIDVSDTNNDQDAVATEVSELRDNRSSTTTTSTSGRSNQDGDESQELKDGENTPEQDEASPLKEYVYERIVGHVPDPTGKEERLYIVRWHGYGKEDDTSEPAHHLPHNAVVRYCRRKKLAPPTNNN